MDESLYNTVLQNLMRLLMNDLFTINSNRIDHNSSLIVATEQESQVLDKKANLVKVIIEVLNLVDSNYDGE